jgi:hypothetical protein
MVDDMQVEVGQHQVAEKTEGRALNMKAVWSVILGILGLTGILFAAAIIAIFLGRSANEEIGSTGARGEGLARTGIVLGWTGLGISLLLIGLLLIPGGS